MAGLAPDSPQSHATSQFSPRSEPKDTTEPTEAYSDIYEELVYLCGGLDKESLDYLTSDKRGLTEQTASDFLLCNIRDYQTIDKGLKAKFDKDELQKAGVLSDEGNLIFYKHKVIIPFLSEGRVVFLQGRRTDEGQPKYLHIKRPVPLFNTDKLKELEKGDKVYLAEGAFDAMILEQNGYNAVAILGINSFKPEYTELFKGFEVVLCLDNPKPDGTPEEKATEQKTIDEARDKITEMFYLKGQGVKVKQLPDGIKDITEYFIKQGATQ